MRIFEPGDPDTKSGAKVVVQNYTGIMLGFGTYFRVALMPGGEGEAILLHSSGELIRDSDCIWMEVSDENPTIH